MGTIWVPELDPAQGAKYRALAHAVRDAIADGTLVAGQKMPPVRELAWALHITPGTVARAYGVLTDEGVLEAAVGRGTFVAAPEPAPAVDEAPVGPAAAEPALPLASLRPLVAAEAADHVLVSSPRLPDVGQVALIQEHLGAVAMLSGAALLRYPTREGAAPARQALLNWLGRIPLGPLDQEDIVLTNGAQNAIALILQAVLRGSRPVVLVEELAYPGFRRAAEMLRAEVAPVAMDAYGLIPEALEATARAGSAQVLCTSPEVHNPTGIFTPYERRRELAEVMRRCDLQVIEDDTYSLAENHAPCYRMLLPERGWYVNSLSKQISPALRVGLGVAPRMRTSDLRQAAERGFFGLSVPLRELSARLLQDPRIDQVARDIRATMNRYVEAAVNILGRYDLHWRHDAAFIWLRLPVGWRASAFCVAAEAAGVQVRPAEDFACRDARAPHAVRIGINAQVTLESFEAAIHRLSHLLDNPPERIGV